MTFGDGGPYGGFVVILRGLAVSFYLVALEVHHDEDLADLLHGDEVAGEVGVLHHLPELVRLDGEGAADALTWGEAVVLEDVQDSPVEGRDGLLHLRTDEKGSRDRKTSVRGGGST